MAMGTRKRERQEELWIATHDVLSSPEFHALLWQEILRLKRESKVDLSSVIEKFDDLFFELQRHQYSKLLETYEAAASHTATAAHGSFAPEYFEALLKLLGVLVPLEF